MTNKLFENKNKTSLNVAVMGMSIILICILLSVLTAFIPSNIGKFDLTSNKMYTLGDISRETAISVSDDVIIYLIAPEGSENESLETLIQRFTKLNKKIKFDALDPDKDENFISKYHSSMIEDNSVLIISGERARYIPYSAFFSYTKETFESCYQIYTVYYQYGYIDQSVTFADFMQYFAPALTLYDRYEYELQLTCAIKTVTSSDTKKLYILSGHGEYELSQDLINRLGVNLFEAQTLNLNTSELPSDTDCLMLIPTKDISEKEYAILSEYLKNGGRLMLLTSYSDDVKFENLLKLTNDFGLTTNFDRYLCEDDENYNLNDYQGLILPDISSSELADALENGSASVMLGGSTGIKVFPTDGINVTPLLTSSTQAYEKKITEETESLEFDESSDTRGSFYTAVKAENSSGGKLVWVSSGSVIYDDYDPHCARGNKEAFIQFLNALTDNTGALNIDGKAVSTEAVDVGASYIYTVLAIFALAALGTLTFGIIRYKKTK